MTVERQEEEAGHHACQRSLLVGPVGDPLGGCQLAVCVSAAIVTCESDDGCVSLLVWFSLNLGGLLLSAWSPLLRTKGSMLSWRKRQPCHDSCHWVAAHLVPGAVPDTGTMLILLSCTTACKGTITILISQVPEAKTRRSGQTAWWGEGGRRQALLLGAFTPKPAIAGSIRF